MAADIKGYREGLKLGPPKGLAELTGRLGGRRGPCKQSAPGLGGDWTDEVADICYLSSELSCGRNLSLLDFLTY